MNEGAQNGTTPDLPAASASTHPERIGPYKILQVLGEGGMGIVYEAEQTVPMTRRVALKVIKLGMDTKQVVARFEAERQALAVMDHPSIATVYDAGVTEAGRPYFAMERVRGVPITEYCDTARLSTRERLALFVALCEAIQHAHQKGVIHRDLKPSNILVTEKDGKPTPKVIDFGIAKAIDRRLSTQTLVTELGQAMGTPAYMSPEQAEMSGLDVDTRTDVYSLGVILYELLVGHVPVDPATIGLPGFVAQLILREAEPPTPSTRLSSMGERVQLVAKQRDTDPGTLRRQLRHDLDWIAMKALEKERNRRYETPGELAADIERFLHGEPVLARGPSVAYRAAKFVGRHKVGVGFVMTLLLTLAAAVVGMTLSRNRALAAEEQAKTEAAKATAINGFLQRMLASPNPWVGGRDVRVADVLDQSVKSIEGAFAGQPVVEAAVRLTVGRTYRGLGLYDAAETQLNRALAVQRTTLTIGDPQIAEALNELGVLSMEQGKYGAADSLLRKALEIRRGAFGAASLPVAETMNNLAAVSGYRADYGTADSLYRQVLEIQRSSLGDRDPEVARTENNLGTLLRSQGRAAEAESLFRSALAAYRAAQGEELDAASVMDNLAQALNDLGRYDEAERLYRESLATRRKSLGDEHPDVARGMNNLGVFLWRTRRYGEAESLIRDALAMNQRTLGSHPDVAANLNNLGLVLRDERRYSDAAALFRQAAEMDGRIFGEDHPEVAGDLNNLGATLTAAGRYREAESTFRESLAIQRKHFGDDAWQTATVESLLGDCLIKAGRYAEAEPLVVRSYEVIKTQFGPAHGRTKAALSRVVAVYEGLGNHAKAAEYRALLTPL
jgi:tetratricopeptide (TPR) repeat protein/tRNA A-37 threonylcarbamoyl transferase component Bud32